MTVHSEHDLREALRAIGSTLAKCEKALVNLKPGTAQHTLLTRRIAAFTIAIELLKERLGE
ncbi:MAG: hypothetical protein PSV23_16570 [Brevundimonas sp.]|uniref:hypothetical protein n=1 Tax=Brevundimonas sp. TaxID=1871086 RepID=UPI002487095B|nr:hypothetical protein [Brevundimonas sp.]MDI1328405.1 hypothetical protein [Brevundimonas sp.]